MNDQIMEEKQRITKGKGRFMVGIALIFDLIPILLIVIAIVLVFYAFSSGIGEDVQDLANSNNILTRTKNKTEIATQAVVGGTATFATGIFLGPILYTIGSFLSVSIGYSLFTLWFYFKGVSIWSFSKPKRALTTALSMAVESIPILNLLPGMTFMVWRHVKLTQIEDHIAHTEKMAGVMSQVGKLAGK